MLNCHQLIFAATLEPSPGFYYEDAETLKGMPQAGLMDYYGGGGYAYDLGRTQESAAQALSYLKENNWIDKETRAIFVDFTLFNQQVNLYSVSFVMFEMMPTGG